MLVLAKYTLLPIADRNHVSVNLEVLGGMPSPLPTECFRFSLTIRN